MFPLIAGLAAPLIKSLVSRFMDEGLNLAAAAIQGGGKKAKEFIEEKTGLSLDKPESLTSEELITIAHLEQNPEAQVELKKLALAEIEEKNRHAEAVRDDVLEDVKSARDMYAAGGKLQDKIAEKVFKQTAILIPVLFVLNAVIIAVEAMGKLPRGVGSGLTGIIGVAIGHSYNERKTLVEFAFGGSLGSAVNSEPRPVIPD